jgi:uncharacterized protein HemX
MVMRRRPDGRIREVDDETGMTYVRAMPVTEPPIVYAERRGAGTALIATLAVLCALLLAAAVGAGFYANSESEKAASLSDERQRVLAMNSGLREQLARSKATIAEVNKLVHETRVKLRKRNQQLTATKKDLAASKRDAEAAKQEAASKYVSGFSEGAAVSSDASYNDGWYAGYNKGWDDGYAYCY